MTINFHIIEYKLHGEPKSFIIRSKTMRIEEAWHWASCDAGFAPIPKPGKAPLKMKSQPLAEKRGISDVRWRAS